MEALGFGGEKDDKSSTYARHPEDEKPKGKPAASHYGVTLEQYATRTMLPIEWLSSDKLLCPGLTDCKHYVADVGDVAAVEFHYRNAVSKFRVALSGKDKFRYGKGGAAALYGVEWLATEQVYANRRIVICEGESDAQTFWFHGIPALGVPGAGSTKAIDPGMFEEVEEVFVIQEPDEQGKKFPGRVADALSSLNDRLSVIPLPLPAKDANELHKAGPDQFVKRFQKAVKMARKKAGVFEWTRTSETVNREWKEIDWICFPLLRPGLAVIWAPALAGKSTVALQLCDAVARGSRALGLLQTKQGAVRYVGWEQGTKDDRRRMWAHIGVMPGSHDGVDFFEIDQLPTSNEGGIVALEKILAANPQIRLLVIDTLARFRGTADKEGGANAMYKESALMADIEELSRDRPKLCVLLVHHSTASGAKISGTEAIRAVPRTIIRLDRPDPDAAEGLISVSHNGAPGAKFPVLLTSHGGWMVDDRPMEKEGEEGKPSFSSLYKKAQAQGEDARTWN